MIQSWICQKCGYVWAFHVKGCENCNHQANHNLSLSEYLSRQHSNSVKYLERLDVGQILWRTK